MTNNFFNPAIECLPLKQLIDLQQQNLIDSDNLTVAARSALYQEVWQQFDFTVQPLRQREDLKKAPYINGATIKKAYSEHDVSRIVDVRQARLWSCTSGTTGSAKWIPYSSSDLELFEEILMRDFYLEGVTNHPHRVLAITSPAPFIGDALTSLAVLAHTRHNVKQELIPIGLGNAAEALDIARTRKADVLVAFPSIAMRIAEGITEELAKKVKNQYRESPSVKLLLARLLFSFRKPRARDIFKLRYGIFSGEAVGPYREAIFKHFGLEPFETYAFTEFPSLNIECTAHAGIHIWSDCCVPEIIPETELLKEETTPGYQPQALFLDEAPDGMRGEYVITTFSQTFPLVRYRTSDLVEVISTGPCGCGRTHPRIRVLRRLDDIINMGLIRFSLQEFENIMAGTFKSGSVDKWAIQLERDGYRPLLKLVVQCGFVADYRAFKEEIMERVYKIQILKQGVETGLVCPPVLVFENNIVDETTATGKLKRVKYGVNW